MADGRTDHDVVVIGSGFGGGVAALRAAEKGYRVAVLEAGRRFADHEFARTSWHLRDFLWAPRLGCHGIFRIDPLRHVLVLSGAGVGGGSLVYANTLYQPLARVFTDGSWPAVTDWHDELAPHYDQASRMLGVTTYPRTSAADAVMRDVAEELGVGHTYRRADVGVLFGEEPGVEVADPYFGGAGPARRTCRHCGECMTGCRHNAKNTVAKNYLHLAEAAEVARRIARRIRGVPVGAASSLANIPVTGHFLGGAVLGTTPDDGVVDPYHRLHGHPGIHVVDGSTVPSNLGVNPSLTITALAERALSLWPNAGDADPRPAPGEPYRRVEPVAPRRPAVPVDAPGALRLPLSVVSR